MAKILEKETVKREKLEPWVAKSGRHRFTIQGKIVLPKAQAKSLVKSRVDIFESISSVVDVKPATRMLKYPIQGKLVTR